MHKRLRHSPVRFGLSADGAARSKGLIAKLTGILDSTGDDWAVLDVGGVGYLVFCSARTLSALLEKGATVSLNIETHVREDHIHLFGFMADIERDWFRLLLTVQGVGAKVALAILSVLPPGDLMQAIAAQDKTAVSRANGVGPKLAARIVNELKDKMGSINLGPAAVQIVGGSDVTSSAKGPSVEAVSALVNLGYRQTDAFGAVAYAANKLGAEAPVESLIPEALKELAS